ncbi:MAG: hypothetical protein JNK53_05845 [Phycisphaerae bacterium]|nr:hypothetical protein [Phycisphaerae bacterium]
MHIASKTSTPFRPSRFSTQPAVRMTAVIAAACAALACAVAPASAWQSGTADQGAAAQAKAAREQATAEAAMRQMLEREAAMRAQREAEIASRENAVVRVAGDSGEMAKTIVATLHGAVTATPMGGSIVLSGEPQMMERAMSLLTALNAQAEADLDRSRAEEARRRELDMVRTLEMSPVETRVFDVAFGPTLGDTLTAVSKSLGSESGPGLNVLYVPDDSLAKLPVRTVQLQRVTLRSALDTLSNVLAAGQSGSPSVELDLRSARVGGERPVVTVSKRVAKSSTSAPATYDVAVFRLQAVHPSMDKSTRDEVLVEHATYLDAIQTGLEIVGRTNDFKIKLHPETGMMFVYGTPSEIRLVAEVLEVPPPQQNITPSAHVPSNATAPSGAR